MASSPVQPGIALRSGRVLDADDATIAVAMTVDSVRAFARDLARSAALCSHDGVVTEEHVRLALDTMTPKRLHNLNVGTQESSLQPYNAM